MLRHITSAKQALELYNCMIDCEEFENLWNSFFPLLTDFYNIGNTKIVILEETNSGEIQGLIVFTDKTIDLIFVVEKYRRLKIGKKLVDHVIQTLLFNDSLKVVANANHGTLCFWFDCGFFLDSNNDQYEKQHIFKNWLQQSFRSEEEIYQKAKSLQMDIDDSLTLLYNKK